MSPAVPKANQVASEPAAGASSPEPLIAPTNEKDSKGVESKKKRKKGDKKEKRAKRLKADGNAESTAG